MNRWGTKPTPNYVQCEGITLKGERCKRGATRGGRFCEAHGGGYTIEEVVDRFLANPMFSAETKWGHMKLYLRRYPMLTIASVSMPCRFQRRGEFTRFLDYCEARFPEVYVEQVVNPWLGQWLERRGYEQYKPINYVKRRKVTLDKSTANR